MSGESFEVNFATGRRFDLDAIRKQRSAFMPDNGHAWVISVIYGIDDPEKALDDMELGEENFIGVVPMYCLLCTVEYRSAIRFHKCPQSVTS